MSFLIRKVKEITSTQAYQNWQASNPGATEIPQDVIDAVNLERQQNKESGNGSGAGGNVGNGNGGNGNGDTKPNKTLLIGGAIAAVALLILILKK